jgi:hypothetical protein
MNTDYPDWFISTIKEILQSPVATPKKPSLIFKLSQEAANHNKTILQAHGNSLQEYIRSHKDTYISFSSEFWSPTVLQKLLRHHPNWPKLNKILEDGSNWPVSPISNRERLAKNRELIERGNHKSALK